MTQPWPRHPRPSPLESLSSWLYLAVPADLDYGPPAAMLAELVERTGADLAQIQATTLAGRQPWLFDPLHLRQWMRNTVDGVGAALAAPTRVRKLSAIRVKESGEAVEQRRSLARLAASQHQHERRQHNQAQHQEPDQPWNHDGAAAVPGRGPSA